jgi:hypothetical protein
MLTMGVELRRAAEARCGSVNAAHFMVHQVMLEAMAGPPAATGRTARAAMRARLDVELAADEAARERDARTLTWID